MAIAKNEFKSVTQMVQTLAKRHRDMVILGVPNKDLKIQLYTFGELELAVNLLATYYATIIPPRAKGDVTSNLTLSLLAPSGFDYAVTEMALSRLGYSVLFISLNNAPAAVASLCQATQSKYLFVAPYYQQLAADSLPFLAESYGLELVLLASPEVYGKKAQIANPSCYYTPPLTPEEEGPLIAFIVHSSGSTSMPKPIFITHSATVYNVAVNFNMKGFTTLPLYHNHGHSCLYRAIYSLQPLWLYPSSDLPLSTSNILGILEQPNCDADAIFGVPYVYKLLGETPAGVAKLKEFKLCLYGGSAMPTELGDKLVAEGVKLTGHYGATEVGQLTTSFRDYATDKDWEYQRIGESLKPLSRWEDRGGNQFELVVLDGWKGKVVSNGPNNTYYTSDLFVAHPTREGLFKFIGRRDDTLVLVNGEKVSPVPMEGCLRGDSPYIEEAIVFGAERAQAGVLVLPSERVPASATREEILDLIRPVITLANSNAPSHSRLSDELIVILPRGTVIPKADKGSIIRRKVYAQFKSEIDRAYAEMEGETGGDADKTPVGTIEEMERALFGFVKVVAGSTEGLTRDTDLFTYGLDSLAAGRIRNFIQKGFNLNGVKLGTNFVFDQPTIALEAKFLVAAASGTVVEEATQVEQMGTLVEKYRHFTVPARHINSTGSSPSDAVVVLTGSTGSLGAQILASLLAKSLVKKVYNLVRASSDEDAAMRVSKSLQEKGLRGVGDSRVIALASDFSEDFLGLSKERYEEIAKEVTLVLHNAWSVNFNLNISSFEPHIRGACNLIKLGLDSDYLADFYFASSVSAVAAWGGPAEVPEEVTADPNVAQSMGYARSKWVTEKLCQIATETTPLRAVVLRIGQMTGSSDDGRWNETEAVSLMFKTGDVLHALPDLSETPSWLPVDCAANTILDLAALTPPALHTSQCWHVMQPTTIPFSSALDSLEATGMTFKRVSAPEWVEILRTGPRDPLINPTIKLLTFFENKYSKQPETGAVLPKRYGLDCKKTVAASKSLREAPLVDAKLMAKYVSYWRGSGFLKALE